MNPSNFYLRVFQYSLYELNIGYLCVFDTSKYPQ